MTSLRIGVFGTGRMGRVHAELLMADGHVIVALGDSVIACANEAKHVLHVSVDTYSDPAEMAKVPMDACFVASHTHLHAKDAYPFVQAGIPVYMEKPLTAKLDEAFAFVQQIGPLARVQVGLQRRFDPALVLAKKWLDDGEIGPVREIRSVLRDQYVPPASYISPGLICDMGIHVADEVCWLLGEFPAQVWARRLEAKEYDSSSAQALKEGGNTAFVGFTTASGTIGRLDLSRTHASGYNNETYIIGTTGTIHVGRFAGYPGPIHVELWRDTGKMDEKLSTVLPMADMAKGQHYAEYLPRFKHAYIEAQRAFCKAVVDQSSFAVNHIDVLDAQVFVQAATLSADLGGQTVDVEKNSDVAAYESFCKAKGLLD